MTSTLSLRKPSERVRTNLMGGGDSKVSIVSVSYNTVGTIKQTIDSVLNQSYGNVEYIIIDGGSTDGTVDVVKSYGDRISKFISEPDKGIYDAMNKGLKLASGDIVGILNSDDMYAEPDIIEDVVETMTKTKVDSCYGDLVYVDREETGKIIRHWRSGAYDRKRFERGWMPPHPAFFVRRRVYEQYGLFNPDFPITADYELMLRFLYRYEVSTAYVPKVLVRMSSGGSSRAGLSITTRMLRENYRAWEANGLRPSVWTFILKPLLKVLQFVKK